MSGNSNNKGFYPKKFFALVGILILSPGLCCGTLWTISDVLGTNDFYFLVTGRYYADLVESKVPEYDRLNDELLADLPVYPGAELITGTERRGGPGIPALGTGPDGPRYLKVCYMVDAPVNDVMDFYESELEKQGWDLAKVDDRVETYITWAFIKGEACVGITNNCPCAEHKGVPDQCPLATYEPQVYPAVYEVDIYYDLNKLLSFPGIPEGGCP